MFKTYVRMRYLEGRMTAAEVWALVDEGKLTRADAASICGPRPEVPDDDQQ